MKGYGINQRLKKLRNSLHMNQERFGRLLNIPAAFVYHYESNAQEVSERTILEACRKLSVNEKWLRTGEGEMLLKFNENLISDLVREFHLEEEDKAFLLHYVYLSVEERKQYHLNE